MADGPVVAAPAHSVTAATEETKLQGLSEIWARRAAAIVALFLNPLKLHEFVFYAVQ